MGKKWDFKNSPAVKDAKSVGKKLRGALGIPEDTEPKKPKAKFGSGEGKINTYLGMAPSQIEEYQKPIEPVSGALDAHINNAINEGRNASLEMGMHEAKIHDINEGREIKRRRGE